MEDRSYQTKLISVFDEITSLTDEGNCRCNTLRCYKGMTQSCTDLKNYHVIFTIPWKRV